LIGRGNPDRRVSSVVSGRFAEKAENALSGRSGERVASGAGQRSRLVNASVKEREARASAEVSGGPISGIAQKVIAVTEDAREDLARRVSGRALRGHGMKTGRRVRGALRARVAKVRGRHAPRARAREKSFAGSQSFVRGRRESSVQVRAELDRNAENVVRGHFVRGVKETAQAVHLVRGVRARVVSVRSVHGARARVVRARFVHGVRVKVVRVRFVHGVRARVVRVRFVRGLTLIVSAGKDARRSHFAEKRKVRGSRFVKEGKVHASMVRSGRIVPRRAGSVRVRLGSGNSLAVQRASQGLAAKESSRGSAELVDRVPAKLDSAGSRSLVASRSSDRKTGM
jgi:hypothetical protein